MSDVSALSLTGVIDGEIGYRKVKNGDGVEEIALFNLNSKMDLGDKVVAFKTVVLARGDATIKALRDAKPESGATVVISGGVAYPGANQTLSCRVDSPLQVKVIEKENSLESHFCDAETFFRENGCRVGDDKKEGGPNDGVYV